MEIGGRHSPMCANGRGLRNTLTAKALWIHQAFRGLRGCGRGRSGEPADVGFLPDRDRLCRCPIVQAHCWPSRGRRGRRASSSTAGQRGRARLDSTLTQESLRSGATFARAVAMYGSRPVGAAGPSRQPGGRLAGRHAVNHARPSIRDASASRTGGPHSDVTLLVFVMLRVVGR